MIQCGGEGVGPVDATTVGHHHHWNVVFVKVAHDLMDELTEIVGVEMRCGFPKYFGSPVLHCPYDREQHTRSDARPTAMWLPSLSLEALLLIDLMTRQRVKGQAIARIVVPPAGSW